MYKVLDFYDFQDEFESYGKDSLFTYDGLVALYFMLIENEKDSQEQRELDVITLCNSYTEYEDFDSITDAYPDLIHSERDLYNFYQYVKTDSGGYVVKNIY